MNRQDHASTSTIVIVIITNRCDSNDTCQESEGYRACIPVGIFGSENEAVGVSMTPNMMSECSDAFTGGKLY